MRCSATTQAGTPCRAAACSGSDRCVQHSADPALVARRTDGARRGGTRPRLATDAPSRSAAPVETDDLDLESPAGLRTLLARVMARVASLPIDRGTANALSQLVTAQRGTIEVADLDARLAALEAQSTTPPLRRSA